MSVKEQVDRASESPAKPAKHRRYAPCEICMSPYRSQIEAAVERHIANLTIAKKFIDKFPGCTRLESMARKIARHIRHLDIAKDIMTFEVKPGDKHVDHATLENFAQRMLDIGDKALNFYEKVPNAIDMKDVIAAQKLLIDKQKIRVQENALKIGMAKLFGGFISTEVEEAEVIDAEPTGNILPSNTQ